MKEITRDNFNHAEFKVRKIVEKFINPGFIFLVDHCSIDFTDDIGDDAIICNNFFPKSVPNYFYSVNKICFNALTKTIEGLFSFYGYEIDSKKRLSIKNYCKKIKTEGEEFILKFICLNDEDKLLLNDNFDAFEFREKIISKVKSLSDQIKTIVVFISLNESLNLSSTYSKELDDNIMFLSLYEFLTSFMQNKDGRYLFNRFASFSKTIEEILSSTPRYPNIDIISLVSDENIGEYVKELIRHKEKYCKIIDDESLKCLYTAEWLYNNFSKSSIFDRSFIVTPYFKCLDMCTRYFLTVNYGDKFAKISLGQKLDFIKEITNNWVFNKYTKLRKYYIKLYSNYIDDYRNRFIHHETFNDYDKLNVIRKESIYLIVLTSLIFNTYKKEYKNYEEGNHYEI